jgi:hypothetical protein
MTWTKRGRPSGKRPNKMEMLFLFSDPLFSSLLSELPRHSGVGRLARSRCLWALSREGIQLGDDESDTANPTSTKGIDERETKKERERERERSRKRETKEIEREEELYVTFFLMDCLLVSFYWLILSLFLFRSKISMRKREAQWFWDALKRNFISYCGGLRIGVSMYSTSKRAFGRPRMASKVREIEIERERERERERETERKREREDKGRERKREKRLRDGPWDENRETESGER